MILFGNLLPGTDYSAFGLTLRVALAGDRRRYAASSNRLFVCRRFELAPTSRGTRSALIGFFRTLAPRDGFEIGKKTSGILGLFDFSSFEIPPKAPLLRGGCCRTLSDDLPCPLAGANLRMRAWCIAA